MNFWSWIKIRLGIMDTREKLADIAESQIGTQEDSAHTNRGAAILKYQQATSLDGQGWPWCAAFVDWCVEQSGLLSDNLRPKTASAFDLIDWGKSSGCTVFYPGSVATPQRGDIVVYAFSHCGIVADPGDGQTFAAIEGNTNEDGGRDGYEVARRVRSRGSVKAFIRLPEA